MSGTVLVGLNVLGMSALLAVLYGMQRRHVSFGKRVLSALILGTAYGVLLHSVFSDVPAVLERSNEWFSVVGTGYVRLLRMIVVPLIFVSITTAVTGLKDLAVLGRAGALIIALLIGTTAVSAGIGAFSASLFGLSSEGLHTGETEIQAMQRIEGASAGFSARPIQQQIVEIIPLNPIAAMAGEGGNATLSVVLFSAFLGVAALGLKRKKPDVAETFITMMGALHDVVLRLVTMVLRLTPYGILALILKFVSSNNFSDIYKLIQFVLASYVGLITIFAVHLIFLAITRYNPVTYIRKSVPVFAFAFTSRSSAGTLPLTIETLKTKYGVPESYANLAGSFGASIGQNGCAGLYPAMLAVMVAPSAGIDPMNVAFLVKLVLVTAMASFGVAGVGGGATFAALVVLSSMGLPVGIAGLLISIEPLIDMGRTVVNVSGAMTAGLVTTRLMGEGDMAVYNSETIGAEDV